MNEAPRYVTLRDYLRVLREQRILILLVAVIFAGAAVFLSVRQAPVYQAEASLQFQDISEESSLLGTQVLPNQAPQVLAAVSAQSVDTPRVASRVKRALKTTTSIRALQNQVSAHVEAQTNLVVVQANAPDANQSARVANEFARQARLVANQDARQRFLDAANSVKRASAKVNRSAAPDSFTRLLSLDRISRLQSLARFATPASIARLAEAPNGPISPRPIRNGILGGLLGLTLGILAAFIRDSLDRRLHSAHDIQEHVRMPLLGSIRNEAMGRAGPLANGRGPMSDADLEAFRILRTNIEFLDVDNPLRSVLVTSPLPEEGKSTVAASLAFASAAAGKRTLLVECDLRRPTLASRLGVEREPGLADYLRGKVAPQQILQTVDANPTSSNGSAASGDAATDGQDGAIPLEQILVCITAGESPPQSAELLGSNRFRRFLDEVSTAYEVVILDATPLLGVVDTLELLPHVDGVVVCVRASRTTRDQVRAAMAAIDHLPERPMGLVVTGIRSRDEADYGYYYSAYRAS